MRTSRLAAICAVLTLGCTVAVADIGGVVASTPSDLVVETEGGSVSGAMVDGAFVFRGLPYAAPPTGSLRWQAPQPAPAWEGVRDATEFAPSCPQQAGLFAPAGSLDEDCLYLNVYTPALGNADPSGHPVLVWIHGGGLATDAARNYDPTMLAAEGTVVVTINYRLGALGFLSHPALSSQPGGPSGNYGLMDQQAALGWVQRNIAAFGGDPHNVTIAGESAGGLSVLAHLVASDSQGLFQKAIVQSGAFALTQLSLADAEAFGQSVAASAGCADQTAECLRALPVDALVNNFPTAAIPGVVDGDVLTGPIGTALAAGRFAQVPILNGVNHDEEEIFVSGLGVAVSGGTFVPLDPPEVSDENYEHEIASTLGVSQARATAIAAEYPTDRYPSPAVALSALLGDANFACTALQVNEWTSALVPTFAYEFADDAAPPRLAPIPVATHGSELPYLFDLPNAPLQDPLNADQQALAASMRAAWANFAASGDPSTADAPWPAFGDAGQGMLLVTPQPQLDADFSSRHHCPFWAAG
jgi:para-nitrobenzyl esterase